MGDRYTITYDSYSKTWAGPTISYPYGMAGIGEVVFDKMRNNLQHVCQKSDDSGEIYTYERMLKASISFAKSLHAMGVKKGDHVLLLMDNHHYMASVWLGCVFAGVIICPFVFTEESIKAEIQDLVEQIQPKIMVTSYEEWIDEFKGIYKTLELDCPIFVYDNKIDDCNDLRPLLERNVNIDDFVPKSINDPANDTLVLTLSSSTTGKSKLIMNTHMQIMSAFLDPPSGVVAATTMKPGWISETMAVFWSFLTLNTRIIRATYTIDDFLRLIEKHRVQFVFMKPKDIFVAIKSDIIKDLDLSCVAIVGSTGEHLSLKVKSEFEKFLPDGVVCPTYGMSDIAGGLTPAVKEQVEPGSVGRVAKNAKGRIADEDGYYLGPNEIGEIYIKNFAPFKGYYQNEGLTRDSVTPDGYFKTGDIGYIDLQGNVFLVDRKKYLISYRGGWINQSEIERIVLDHVNGVSSVCVVDVEDDTNGVIPVIAIIPEKGVSLKEQHIIDTVNEHHEFPFETRVFFFEKLPITLSGKYRKHLVRELVLKLM